MVYGKFNKVFTKKYMKTYFATFISGTQEIIEVLLKKRKAKILKIFDGLVVFETEAAERDIRNYRFLNNVFRLLYEFKDVRPTNEYFILMVKKVLGAKNFIPLVKSSLPSKRRRFKIVFSLENQMVSVDRGLVKKLEEKLYFIEDLKLSVKKPDLEFWFILRSEGVGFFGTRISYNYDKIESKQKGELRTELAYLLSFLSIPSPEDIVLDPFAGYGSIPKERIHSFPYKFLIAVDRDKNLTLKLKNNLSKHRNIKILCANALNLKEVKDETIDKIITDPPWGEYQKIDNLVTFYIDMLKEFKRILVNKGVAVILTGSVEKFEEAMLQSKGFFEVQRKLKILVSGKKASIFKIIKKG